MHSIHSRNSASSCTRLKLGYWRLSSLCLVGFNIQLDSFPHLQDRWIDRYHIALNFRVSKFSQMAIFEDSNEENLLHVDAAHLTCYGCGIQAWSVCPTRTVPSSHYCHLELTAVSKAMPTSKVSPWKEFLADSAA